MKVREVLSPFVLTPTSHRCPVPESQCPGNRVNVAELHITPEQEDAFRYYSKNSMSIEVLKDDILQKVNFRVTNKVGTASFEMRAENALLFSSPY